MAGPSPTPALGARRALPPAGGAAGAKADSAPRSSGVGNQRWLHASASASSPRPALLPLDGPFGRRNDPFERHADAVAAKVTGAATGSAPGAPAGRDTAGAPGGNGGAGAPLARSLQEQIAPWVGANLGGVRVHDGHVSRHTAAVLGARAFTIGHDIHLGPGQSAADSRLMAHEATHAVQQSSHAAAPRVQLDATNQSITPGYGEALDDGDLMFELQTAEALLHDTSPTDPMRETISENIKVLRDVYFTRSPGTSAETQEPMSTTPPPAAAGGEIPAGGTEIGRVGVVAWDGETQLRLRSTPDTESDNIIEQLPFSTRLVVIKSFPGDWYFVSTPGGSLGYAASQYIFMDLPEPNARLHRVQAGLSGTAIAIAERYYGEYADDWGQDLRFYINVLAWANNINVPDSTFGWRQVHFRAGQLIWVPSQRFAYGLKGVVNSGSISWNIADAVGIAGILDRLGELWDDFQRALDYSDEFRAEAMARRIEQSAQGLIEGLIEMIKLAIAILAITTAVGAVLGAIFGAGAGAAPGAAAGFEVGMVIIEWLGLGMLVMWIGQSLIELASAFGTFLSTVWDAHGDREVLRRAGAEWADAIALLVAKILEALLMLVMARGLPKGLEALRGTRLGRAMGESRAASWLSDRAGRIEAGKSLLPSPSTVLSHIRGRPVQGDVTAPVTQQGNAAAFHNLAPDRLPANLPAGHYWTRSADGGQWVLMREAGAAPAPFELTVYADAAGNVNYNLRTGDRLIQSDAITRQGTTYTGPDRLPQNLTDTGARNPYRDPVTGRAWDKGHGVDHADTLQGPGVLESTTSPANFTPQAKWWNQGARNHLVQQIRGRRGGYREMAVYDANPPVTANGTPIPREFVFVETNAAGAAMDAWRIPNRQGAAGQSLAAINPMRMQLADVPPVMMRPATTLAGPGGATTLYSAGLVFGLRGDEEDEDAEVTMCAESSEATMSVDEPQVCEP